MKLKENVGLIVLIIGLCEIINNQKTTEAETKCENCGHLKKEHHPLTGCFKLVKPEECCQCHKYEV